MTSVSAAPPRFCIPPCDATLAPPTDIQVPFEGVEKRLVVYFKSDLLSPCRPYDFTRPEWQSILDYAHCEIVSERHLGDTSVYLLSESTLTVWPNGFLLKTCGRTTPFLVLDVLQKYVYTSMPLVDVVDWFLYSRLDFLHPEYQVWPHQSHLQEQEYLDKLIPAAEPFDLLAGNHSLVGFVYTNPSQPLTTKTCIEFEEALMMQIDRHCVRTFSGFDTPEEQTLQDDKSDHYGYLRPTLRRAAPSRELDEFWFSPFGYSSNALAAATRDATEATYFSCHVSPEPETSYASLEVGGPQGSSHLIPIADLVPAFNAKLVHITKVSFQPSGRNHLEAQLKQATSILKSSGYHLRQSSSVLTGQECISIHHVLLERPATAETYLSLADLSPLSFKHHDMDRPRDQITNALTTASGDDLSDKPISQD